VQACVSGPQQNTGFMVFHSSNTNIIKKLNRYFHTAKSKALANTFPYQSFGYFQRSEADGRNLRKEKEVLRHIKHCSTPTLVNFAVKFNGHVSIVGLHTNHKSTHPMRHNVKRKTKKKSNHEKKKRYKKNIFHQK